VKVVTRDLSHLEKFVRTLELMYQHRRANPTSRSDELYYGMLARYFRRVLDAPGQGHKVVAHTVFVPNELFAAFDLVPLHLESLAVIMVPTLKNSDEVLGAAKGFGIPVEICSAHRSQTGLFVQGWVPAQAVLWSHQICDSSSKSGELLAELYHIPSFFMDRPYNYGDRDALYYSQEMNSAIGFLEEVSGQKADWERLEQAVEYSRQMVELHREIYELRQAVPCPSPNRLGTQLMFAGFLWMGTPEGVSYFEACRDELRERVGQKRGFIPQERFRIVSIFPPPAHKWKLLDWLEREHGAVVVADPYCSHWGPVEWNEKRPLLTLARKYFASPLSRQMHGPAAIGWIPDSVEDALSHQAEGAVYWAHIGCRHGCSTIKMIKDALLEKAGIPMLVIDIDVLDPTFVTEEELREKLEGFLEMLETRK